jgi:hypothetical protein
VRHLEKIIINMNCMSDIEQVLKEKKPFILHCMPSDLKVLQGRSPVWNQCALNASIIEV